ncbi:MAG: DNA topoisomerase IV subunit A [Lentisphaerae bacterium]|nr:DNA topoisomerase IV subunit A [Lentisphaerota bacterium]
MDFNFIQFASYTICSRAIPTIEDGLKPVQRRILHSLWEMDDGRFIKVANVVGNTMKYHPHGDASIGDALVNLVNKRYLIEGQGNYGNLHTGDPAAAPRYIECRLTELARREVFSPKTTDYTPSYDGRNKEPVLLPAKLPLLLMLGAEGIAVGLSTNILPHNFIELLEAEIAIIQNKPFQVFPDFQTGGMIDVSEYQDGVGRVKLRSHIEASGSGKVVIRELPYGQTTESLIRTIEDAIKKKKVPVRQINDFTAAKVEIELVLTAGTAQDKAIKALYAFTACETSTTSRPVLLHDNKPREATVSEILKLNVEQLLAQLQRELELQRDELNEDFHNRTLERIFIEERIYKQIEEMPTYEQVLQAVFDGLKPFRDEVRRDISQEDVERLLQIRIRRISLFDINKNREDIANILKELGIVEGHLKSLKRYAVNYLKGLIKTYKDQYPRLTQIKTFGQIELRALTATELTLKYDAENGYIGTDIRTGDTLMECSSLDKIIVAWDDGRYRIMPPPDKFFVDKSMIYCAIFDRDREMTCIYTESHFGITYIKRFTFGGAIQNKDYQLTPEKSKVLLLSEGTPETAYIKYKPSKGQKIHQQAFTLAEALVKGVAARGQRMTTKGIARLATTKPRWWQDDEKSPKGVLL